MTPSALIKQWVETFNEANAIPLASLFCIVENIFEDGDYWDKLSFLQLHQLPIPIN